MKERALLVLAVLSVLQAFSFAKPDAGTTIQFCDLVNDPVTFEGKRVRVFAVLNYGFERSELLCMECRTVGKLVEAKLADDSVKKQFKRAPKDHGIISASFVGIFRRRASGYGGYAHEIEIESVKDIRVLVKNMKTPLASIKPCCRMAK
jgi:hypothetical protein